MIGTLRTIAEGEIEDIALENMINAKLTQLVATKNVRFKQYANSDPAPLGYYSFCFIPSGFGKDKAVRFIDKNFMPFLKDKITKMIDRYKQELQSRLYAEAAQLETKARKEAEKLAEEQLRQVRPCNINIADATFTALYYEAEKIEQIGYGAICIKLMELGDYIRDAVKGDGTAKELLPKLKDVSDGDFNPRLTRTDADRHEISGIATIGIFCCDFNSVRKEKNKEYLMELLDGGMGRRSFVYFFDKNVQLNPIELDWKREEKAYQNAKEIAIWLEDVFDKIPMNMVCEFSNEAKDLLNEFKKECKQQSKELMQENELLAKAYGGAYWIVSKLSVTKAVIAEPTNNLISVKYVEQAIDFYRRIKPYLSMVIKEKEPDEVDKLRNFMLQWAKKASEPIKSGEIRKGIDHTNTNTWKSFKNEWLPYVLDWLEKEHNIIVRSYTGFGGNTEAWQAVK